MYISTVDEVLNYIMETDTYQCDIVLPKFCCNHYNFFKTIISSHNILLTS